MDAEERKKIKQSRSRNKEDIVLWDIINETRIRQVSTRKGN